MEFIQFVDRVEIEIIRMVEQAGYSIEENTALCLISAKYAGFLKKRERTIVICTDNAKKLGKVYGYRNNKDSEDSKHELVLHNA